MITGNFSLERVEAARRLQVNLVEQMGPPPEIKDREALNLLFNAYTTTIMRGRGEARPIEHQLAHIALRARLRDLASDDGAGSVRWEDAEPVVRQPVAEAELVDIQDFERKTLRAEGGTDQES
jgi:hypothetical protein